MHRLEILALRDNNMRDRACAAVLSSLLPVHTLRRLDLARNRAGDRAMAALLSAGCGAGGALAHLECLDLSHNRLGNKRTASLARLLLEHPRLRTLELGHNEIGGQRHAADVAAALGERAF